MQRGLPAIYSACTELPARRSASVQHSSFRFRVPASDALLSCSAALLLIAVTWYVPRIALAMQRPGFASFASGALLPLLDPLRFSLTSEDQIAFLTQDPVFAGPLPGLAAVGLAAGAAVLLGVSPRRCVPWVGWTAGGLLLAVMLSGLTSVGAPWLAPFSAHRYAFPLLPRGHFLLIAGTSGALALLELVPKVMKTHRAKRLLRRWVLGGLGTWIVLLAAPDAVAYADLMLIEGDNGATGAPSYAMEPDPFWPVRWLDIMVTGNDYLTQRRGWGGPDDGLDQMPRWNDQVSLLRFLDDPVVRRIYFEAFRHPVARTEASGSKLRLTVRELADARLDAPGPMLRVEIDVQGRERLYEVDRLY